MSKELEKQDEWQERCKKLVSENDELLAEIMNRVKYEGFLRSVVHCKGTLEDNEDFEWFKKRMEELKK